MRSIEIPQPGERTFSYRAFEILPAALTWLILLLPVILSLISPKLASYFVIAYMMIWFIRVVGFNVRSLQGWRLLQTHKALPWPQLNADLENLAQHAANAPAWHARNLERVERYIGAMRIKPSEIYHAVFVAFVNESAEILEPTLEAVINADYDNQKMILVLAYEGRAGKPSEDLAAKLIAKYGKHFYHAMAVGHPADMPGEVIGKGGNITFAGHEFKKYVDARGLDPSRILVTTLDSDNRPHPQYFAALSYTYCSTEEPKYASYQPVAMFTNNIWDAPAPMRVVATGNSFYNVIYSMRPHALRNFSAHAQPLSALYDTDFWSVRTIVEDGHQFWRTFFRYDGHHQVYPLYIPIYQDAVLTDSYKRTLKAQFIQIRRWAWGASDVAYVAYMGFLRSNHIPKRKIVPKFFRLLENHVSWSTMPVILTLAAFVPFFLNPQSYIANQLPQIASKINTLAILGIFVSMYLSFKSLPPKPARYRRHRNLWMVVQWIYLPFTTLLYYSLAAIYSQTRLALGWYIGKFDVTEKAVKSERHEISTT